MRKLSSQQQFAAVTISLSLAVAAFPTFSTNASRVMPQDVQPPVLDSLHQKDRYRLAQTSDNCRRVAASGGLQVRQQPSIGSTVIGVVEDGRQVAIKNSGASGWVQIYAPLNGYVSTAYLKYCSTVIPPAPTSTPTPSPTPTPTPTPTPSPTSTTTSSSGLCRRVVADGGLQVRQQPSIGSTVVGFVANGQNVTIEDRGASGWVSISAPLQGYVSAAYLRYCPEAK